MRHKRRAGPAAAMSRIRRIADPARCDRSQRASPRRGSRRSASATMRCTISPAGGVRSCPHYRQRTNPMNPTEPMIPKAIAYNRVSTQQRILPCQAQPRSFDHASHRNA